MPARARAPESEQTRLYLIESRSFCHASLPPWTRLAEKALLFELRLDGLPPSICAEGGGETLERGSDSNADETEKCRPPDTMDAN